MIESTRNLTQSVLGVKGQPLKQLFFCKPGKTLIIEFWQLLLSLKNISQDGRISVHFAGAKFTAVFWGGGFNHEFRGSITKDKLSTSYHATKTTPNN